MRLQRQEMSRRPTMQKSRGWFWIALASTKGVCFAHECGDGIDAAAAIAEPDWLENEVIAGFRVWQILFLIVAGITTLVVVACCFTRCRIPRTRQEIEANHKRNQITLLFRSYLDRVPVEEIDLMWALDVVKSAAEKRNSKKKKKKKTKVETSNENLENSNEEEAENEESESDGELKPMTLLEKIKSFFKKKPPTEFSDEESNQLSSNLDNYSL